MMRRWFGRPFRTGRGHTEATSAAFDADCAALRRRCLDLEALLQESETRLRERSELLYALQKQYSSEHFSLHETGRDLRIERMRNAGSNAARRIAVDRAVQLQRRIGHLKERLRQYECVEDEFFDAHPIVNAEDTAP